MNEQWFREYVLLAFRMDKAIRKFTESRFVDYYYGPPEWKAEAEAEAERSPSELVRDAIALEDALAEPMYCGNQVYVTCEHRLDCKRCGMFIGGDKARLLREGEQVLPVTSKAPMTPLEICVVEGDQEGAQACRAALQQIPAPETPDITLIFNPEGLSNHELAKLAELGTAEALEKLQQACDAHVRRLTEAQQSKTGRNALVGAQKKRVKLLQDLV